MIRLAGSAPTSSSSAPGSPGLAAALAAHRAGRRVMVLSKAPPTPRRSTRRAASRWCCREPRTPSTPMSTTRWRRAPGCATRMRCARSSPTVTAPSPNWSPTERVSTRRRPGRWALTREGGHSRRRIIHAGGDATGAEVQRALNHAAATPRYPAQSRCPTTALRRRRHHRRAGAQRRRGRASCTRRR